MAALVVDAFQKFICNFDRFLGFNSNLVLDLNLRLYHGGRLYKEKCPSETAVFRQLVFLTKFYIRRSKNKFNLIETGRIAHLLA